MEWDEYFVSMLYLVAMKSKDMKTQNAAIIVDWFNRIKSTGYNSFPTGINDYVPERQERPEKYYWFEHGERNAIYNAAKNGVSLDRCKIYVTGIPCMDCSRGIIQSGIIEVIYHVLLPYDSKLWEEHNERSLILFKEAGVKIREYTGSVVEHPFVRRDGKEVYI